MVGDIHRARLLGRHVCDQKLRERLVGRREPLLLEAFTLRPPAGDEGFEVDAI
jgi:hypothetical protein